MKKVDDEWWWWILNYSYRDQFSYMFCLWKYNIKRVYFLPEGLDAHNNNYFVFTDHNSSNVVSAKKWVKTGFFEARRNINRNRCKMDYDRYCHHWVTMCKMPCPKFLLFFWGIAIDIWNVPKRMITRRISKLFTRSVS